MPIYPPIINENDSYLKWASFIKELYCYTLFCLILGVATSASAIQSEITIKIQKGRLSNSQI